MKQMLLAIVAVAALSSTCVSANTIPENDKAALKLFFSASTPESDQNKPVIPPMPNLDLFSARVTAPTSCKGNVGLSISNAFTDGTLKKIYENFDAIVNQLASRDGAIYLGSLYLSKSNPPLYQLITEGVSVGVDDFLSAMGSCEAMAESLIDNVASPLIEMQKNTKLNKLVEENAQTALDEDWNDIRVEELVQGGMDKLAEEGVTIFGKKVAGKNQPPLDINDTLKTGWCVYRGFTLDQCEAFMSDGDEDEELEGTTETDKLIIATKEELKQAGVYLVGNKYLSICQGCESVTIENQGVSKFVEKEQRDIANNIKLLANKRINQIEEDEYKSVSFPPSIEADGNYFRNLAALNRDADVREMYIQGWAYDIAYQRSIHAMDMVENSLRAAGNTDDVKEAGLTKEYDRMLDQLESQRRRLERNADRNNYTPKMYIRSLLSVSQRLSDGKSPIGLRGVGL